MSSSSNDPPIRLPTRSVYASLLARRRLLAMDSVTNSTRAVYPTETLPSSSSELPQPVLPITSTPSQTRRREREAQRNLLDAHRDTLRAAERTISLLREQIRLHDERARLSIASLAPLTPPAGTPARTPTQRAALERSLSNRIANLQADIERQQSRVGVRRPETEALLEERNISRRSSPRTAQRLNSNACPFLPFSSLPAYSESLPIYSSDRLSDDISSSSSSLPISSSSTVQSNDPDRQRSSSMTSSLQEALEREWERQLADGEVDSNGVPILPDHDHKLDSSLLKSDSSAFRSQHHPTTTYSSSSRAHTTHLGRRKVDGLGLQLALVSHPSASGTQAEGCSSLDSSFLHPSAHLSRPACLR